VSLVTFLGMSGSRFVPASTLTRSGWEIVQIDQHLSAHNLRVAARLLDELRESLRTDISEKVNDLPQGYATWLEEQTKLSDRFGDALTDAPVTVREAIEVREAGNLPD